MHPVTPIIGGGRLFVFMEPTSPKARDLDERGWYALHNGVPDTNGSGGEFWLTGRGNRVEDVEFRQVAASRVALHTGGSIRALRALDVHEARCNGYGDVALPESVAVA